MNFSYDCSITFPTGFKASGAIVGIKANGNYDLGLLVSETAATSAAVFTRNKFKAAPVVLSRENLIKSGHRTRAIIVNSGCANALTGKKGTLAAIGTVAEVAKQLRVPRHQVLVASTGVIGRELPLKEIKDSIPGLLATLKSEPDNHFVESILTTDKFPKQVSLEVALSSKKSFRIGATAKGAGMIHPNMATMLCFVTTDAAISQTKLAAALGYAVDRSFNTITVDGDTSTNDTVYVLANGASGVEVKTPADYRVFADSLLKVLRELAMMIVRDGEGATRFVTVNVESAASYADAVKVGRAVGTSPLVKTAIFGGDPNWGRILSAVGNSEVKFDPAKVELKLEGKSIFKRNEPQPVDLRILEEMFSKKEIEMTIRLNAGKESARVFTCDLSYDYVKINGEYTT